MTALWQACRRWLAHAPIPPHASVYSWGYIVYYDANPMLLTCMFLGGIGVGLALWFTFPHARVQPSSRAYVVLMSGVVGNSILGAFKEIEYAPQAICKYHVAYAINDAFLALGTYVALRLLMRLRR